MSKLKDFYTIGGMVGVVSPFIGGYYSSSNNTGFTAPLGNSVADVNTFVNPEGYYVCDGSELNVSGSVFFDGAGRYLPNITDDRFIMGDLSMGGVGGDNTMVHTHDITHTHSVWHTHTLAHTHSSYGATLSITQIPSHRHVSSASASSAGVSQHAFGTYNAAQAGDYTAYEGSGGSHSHGSTTGASVTNTGNPSSTNTGGASVNVTGAASNTENRPKFLSAVYILKVI